VHQSCVSECASANQNVHTIDLFNAGNFANMGQHSLVKQMLDQTTLIAVDDNLRVGEVTYTQCDDDTGSFTLDTDSTSNDPNPVTKGQDVSLNLVGIVSDSIEVKNVHIHVDWNGTPLYDEDNKQDNTYDSDYTYSLKWNVPSYAPSGDYDITVTGLDDAQSKLLCVEAKMTL
jgi:hypothetical protein